MTEFKDILVRKRVLKATITKLENNIISSIDDADSSQLALFENKIEKLNEELHEIFNAIFSQCKEEDVDNFVDEQQSVQDKLDNLWLSVNRKNSKFTLNESNQNNSLSKSQTPEVKLPKLSLPTFSGNLEEWISFYGLFKASVDNNESLSDCQKLQYLKSACKNSALKIIQSLPISDSNYKTALELLKERYSNKRELINALIKELIGMSCISDNAQSILESVDIINECVRSLSVLEQDVSGFSEVMIVYVITDKLDKNTRYWWERTLKKEEVGTFDNLLSFLKDHARTLQNSKSSVKEIKKGKVTTLLSASNSCCVCKESHPLYKCPKFLQLSVHERIELIKRNNLCYNCLLDKHHAKICKSLSKCRVCHKPHHTILHLPRDPKSYSDSVNETPTGALSPNAPEFQSRPIESLNQTSCTSIFEFPNNSVSGLHSLQNKQTLLCTAIIKVRDSLGNLVNCRALLDSGSEASFISENCMRKLCLPRQSTKVQVTCLGSYNAESNEEVNLNFTPHFNSELRFATRAFVIKRITSNVPYSSIPSNIVNTFNDLVLADPLFFESRPVDILLGVNVFFTLLKREVMKRGEILPFAVCSKLGWIITGTTSFDTSQRTFSVNNIQLQLDDLVQKFWSLDSIPELVRISKEEQECEDHFKSNYFRNSSGRFVVKLPFKDSPSQLGDTKELAMQRFFSLERRLSKQQSIYENYREFMKEYSDLGHMERISKSERVPAFVFYLPHHAVIRESSTTTKLRVVFDASAKSTSGVSLNDILMVGPRIQQELFPILLRFRTLPIVVRADMEKMFRQILINPEDRDFLRILWRENSQDPIEEYRLTTVTYGTASAPFLSTRALHQLALDEKNYFPLASAAVLKDFYVDDFLSGGQNEEKVVELISQLTLLMKRGGFNLQKWISNVPGVLRNISEECKESTQSLFLTNDGGIKSLGIQWNLTGDFFCFTALDHEKKDRYSKRDILSEVAKVFDPLGLLSPCVVFMKVLLQDLWKFSLTWDEPISEELSKRWTSFRTDLKVISKLRIPRFVLAADKINLQIHAFCDASEKAYCAAIYMRSVSQNEKITVNLLTSKTKVAPIKTQSIPRLELCSALLLTNLLKVVLDHLSLKESEAFAWTDSKVALAWLSSEPHRWQTFVANRVAKIQETLPNISWNHVRGLENPADCGTRGMQPSELVNCELWFHGPKWLREPWDKPPNESFEGKDVQEIILKEEKRNCVVNISKLNDDHLIFRYSSWNRLVRIVAWCLRFVDNARKSLSNRVNGWLSVLELSNSTTKILKIVQHQCFFDEICDLSHHKSLKSSSKLLSLNPFLGHNCILRVGGRLRHANVSEDQKHPMLLPKTHHITALIIKHYHITYLHAGPQLLLAVLRTNFWILSGRDAVRKIVRSCLKCFHASPSVGTQIMGDLPAIRVTPSRPFSKTGVDYAGPFMCKERNRRNIKSFKSYIAIFICFSTRAIHLELVSDLTASTFLAALKRFVARRGKPAESVSDCAGNFKGASRELRELYKSVSSISKDQTLQNYVANEGIIWNFNPPSAPHFGGLWEANIKSVKYHLRRTMGNSLFTIDEFSTLLSQIEASLNSRPLCPLSNDPSDLQVLTPGHFLTGAALTAIPELDVSEIPPNRLRRWQLTQRVFQHFWKRWSGEYLSQLQQRPKWLRSTANLNVGDLVLIKNELFPPLQWKLGRIIQTFPGPDGRVRVAIVRTAVGNFKRPVHKLCPLPSN